jgi:hypothetical protein
MPLKQVVSRQSQAGVRWLGWGEYFLAVWVGRKCRTAVGKEKGRFQDMANVLTS